MPLFARVGGPGARREQSLISRRVRSKPIWTNRDFPVAVEDHTDDVYLCFHQLYRPPARPTSPKIELSTYTVSVVGASDIGQNAPRLNAPTANAVDRRRSRYLPADA